MPQSIKRYFSNWVLKPLPVIVLLIAALMGFGKEQFLSKAQGEQFDVRIRTLEDGQFKQDADGREVLHRVELHLQAIDITLSNLLVSVQNLQNSL